MKKNTIKIVIVITVVALLLALVLIGCDEETVNAAPQVDGAHDFDCIVDTPVDILDGVAALDDEDGDITPDMAITITPEAELRDNGYAVFPEEGNYRVTYTATDSTGRSTSESVIVSAVERELYMDFSEVSGFKCTTSGGAALTDNGMYDGVYRIKASGAEIAEDVSLSRDFTLTGGEEYRFSYRYYSNKAGRVNILADGVAFAVKEIFKGENVLEFSYVPLNKGESAEVEISVLLGALEEFEFYLLGAEYTFAQNIDGELLQNFSLAGRVHGRFDGTNGNAWVSEDGKAATLEVTSAHDVDIWRGGMFIDTGLTVSAGVEYTVSYTIVSSEAKPFEVILKRDQWGENRYDTFAISDATTASRVSRTFIPDADNAGAFWIYVQSGNEVNNITISDLSVVAKSDGNKTEVITLKDFVSKQADGYQGELHTFGGSFTYTIPSFAPTDWQQQVIGPEFYVGGSGENYVVTFKAKASKPVVTIFAAVLYGGWDPTWVWSRFTITEDEQVYTFFCNSVGGNRLNNFVWQFGSQANQAYNDVKIEISDVKISYKDATLD